MGAFASAIAIIIDIITLVAITVATIIATVSMFIAEIIVALAIITVQFATWAVTVTINAMVIAIQAVYITVSAIVLEGGFILSNVVTAWATAIQYIAVNYTLLLDTVGFKMMMAVNKIGLYVSKDYRKLMLKFTRQLMQLSEFMGMAAETMPHILKRSEQASLMFSSMVGRCYEVGKIDFVKHFQNWDGLHAMEWMNRKMDLAELEDWIESDGPTRVISGIVKPEFQEKLTAVAGALPEEVYEEWFEVREFNLGLMADFFQGISGWRKVEIQTINTAVEALDKVVGKVIDIDEGIEKVKKAIPPNWAETISEAVDPSLNKIKAFISKDYEGLLNDLSLYLEIQRLDIVKMRDDITDLAYNMNRPGSLMENTRKLDMIEQRIEEYKIANMSNKALENESANVNNQLDLYQESATSKFDDVTTRLPKEGWQGKEKENTEYPPGKEPKPGTTWYRGDY